MIKRKGLHIFLLFSLLMGCAALLPVTAKQKPCKVARQLLQTLRTFHVDPPLTDSLFSERVLQEFVQNLDPGGFYLTQQSIQALRKDFQNLEKNIQKGKCTALETGIRIFNRQYLFVDSLRNRLLQEPLVLSDTDVLRLSLTPNHHYVADSAALVERWHKQLRYLLLYEAYMEAGEGVIKLENEAALRKKVQERLICRRSRLLDGSGGLAAQVGEHFLSALSTAFDPHTNYFPPTTKQQFMASLSTETESFGIQLHENAQGDIEISRLIPGGPAWKSNELHEGDVLLSLHPKKGQAKSFSCTSAEEAEALLADVTLKQVQLVVRKKSGQSKKVNLVKERLQVEENVVSSFVLKGEHTFGYLALPAFYSQLDGPYGRGVATDVAREIINLLNADIEGIVLDLRFNGGGSVMEALKLAGMFIDEGTLGVESDKFHKNQPLRDMIKGTIYDGPVVLLVNSFSASASEILAQALQTYNRALVIGSPTYGKATVQVIMPISGQEKSKPKEPFVKMTIAKYYGPLGSSYQSNGIIPDIELSDGISVLGMREAAYPTALRADVITNKFSFHPDPALPTEALSFLSEQRLLADTAYNRQLERTNKLAGIVAHGFPLRLSPRYFKADYEQLIKLYDESFTTGGAVKPPFELQNLPETEKLLERDEELKTMNTRIKEELKNDVWLTETYHVMLDLLQLQPGRSNKP
ncbi:S41 family peptidase [Cesiribacter sp. SM1]|uniref:S41 family peptidase n=1 Tax=Cesiribacter sp. SM1 TaxID=2861196 RepID=UPI001CD7F704|nr:S41 family peptidase [Cesiribacter sp. SM1]